MTVETLKSYFSDEEAFSSLMNYNNPQETFSHISSSPNYGKQFLVGLLRLLRSYYGNVGPTDFLIKKYGTRFQHIELTKLSQYMDRLCTQIFNRNQRYKGSLEAIGSEAEGIRVNTSDYDFLLVSKAPNIQFEKLEIQLAEMPSVRADTKSEANLLKSYFKIFFKDDVPEEWENCTETGSKCLNARLVQKAFAEALADRVKAGTEPNWSDQPASFIVLNKGDNTVTLNGPAASFVVIDRTNGKPKRMNIDITFAIPLNLTNSTDLWPLDGQFPGVELTDHVRAGQPIKAVHLVPAGDFWRLSFVLEERERMKKLLLDENKHTCMVALKAMRNSVSLTHGDESPLLSSYPLKWSFMMEARGAEHETWQEDTLGYHAVSILDRVVRCGSNGSMSSFFLKGDHVLKDSDRSFLESRRIKKLIEDENHMCAYILGFYNLHFFISMISFMYYSYMHIGIQFRAKNNTSECAETSADIAIILILPGFILYAIVVVGVAFSVYARLRIAPRIFVVTVTLYNCLLLPMVVLTMNISEYAATLHSVLLWLGCIYSSVILAILCKQLMVPRYYLTLVLTSGEHRD